MDIFTNTATTGLGDYNKTINDNMKKLHDDFLAAEAEKQKQKALEKEADALKSKFTMSGEQQREMERLRLKSEGQDLMSQQIAEQQQKEAQQRIRSMSTMRGYDANAARAAGRAASLAGTNIQNQARVQAEQEKAQALYDYNAMVQYKNQIAYAGEQAHDTGRNGFRCRA